MFDDRIEFALHPDQFGQLVEIMSDVDESEKAVADAGREVIQKLRSSIDEQAEQLAKADEQMAQELRRTRLRKRRAFEDPDEEQNMLNNLARTASKQTFIGVVLSILDGMQGSLDSFENVLRDLEPQPLLLPKDYGTFHDLSYEELRNLSMMMRLNSSAIGRFVSAVESIEQLRNAVVHGAVQVAIAMDHYYQLLLKRHTVEGVEIQHNPVTTDIAISVYENIDAHGEISEGRKPDEISAYSMRKAVILAETVKSQAAKQFITEPDDFIDKVIGYFNSMWEVAEGLSLDYRTLIDKVRNITDSDRRRSKHRFKSRSDFDHELQLLRDLNPNAVGYKDKTGLLSSEERFLLKFRNQTLRNVARRLISSNDSSKALVDYVLGRKAELHKYFTEENSFYVCKIGTGNNFMGEAPGQLEVVPGTKPTVNLDEIIGSGFDEIRDFIKQVETSSKWHDLFVATSPSRTADKSNVLLIGPQGCGKTEALRAVGADSVSVSVFAQGSDFMTCWAGEAQKNPKRLFERAVEIQREANRHVYILIDEIDQVLHTDSISRGAHFNLTREFQILMDGVVSYPSLSVWGATNHPDRIPMPMIRRFSKTVIVGELSIEDRVKLLQHYTGFMPVRGFTDEKWMKLAERLDGATGDIVRKIVDPIWRAKMHRFTEEESTLAKKLVDWLNCQEKFDVRRFNAGHRAEFHARLKDHVCIEPEDIDVSIEEALGNLAILNEIRTAKETYVQARALLTDLREQQGA